MPYPRDMFCGSFAATFFRTQIKFQGGEEVFEFQITPRGLQGHFEIFVNNHRVGEGYCMSVQCHYKVQMGSTTVEETWTFYEGRLYKLGSKQIEGKKIAWEESLETIRE